RPSHPLPHRHQAGPPPLRARPLLRADPARSRRPAELPGAISPAGHRSHRLHRRARAGVGRRGAQVRVPEGPAARVRHGVRRVAGHLLRAPAPQMRAATPEEIERWDELIAANPNGGEILQTRGWAEFKTDWDWEPRFVVGEVGERTIATLFLTREVTGLGRLWY